MPSIKCPLCRETPASRTANVRFSNLDASNVFVLTQRNLIKSTRNQIVFTMYRLIWNQTNVRLNPNQSEKGKYNLISVSFNKISKRFLCVKLGIDSLQETWRVPILQENAPAHAGHCISTCHGQPWFGNPRHLNQLRYTGSNPCKYFSSVSF